MMETYVIRASRVTIT